MVPPKDGFTLAGFSFTLPEFNYQNTFTCRSKVISHTQILLQTMVLQLNFPRINAHLHSELKHVNTVVSAL